VKPYSLHPDALDELQQQALYYDERSEGLGSRFTDQVEIAANLAATMPGVGSPYKFGTRRVFPTDFPFSVVYRDMRDELFIIAIAAFRRKPGYWRGRK